MFYITELKLLLTTCSTNKFITRHLVGRHPLSPRGGNGMVV